MFTRRRFLLLLPSLAALPRLEAEAQHLPNPLRKKPVAPPPPAFVYFGADTDKGVSKGIYFSRFDFTTGHLTPPALAAATLRPSFLAISAPVAGRRRLYAVNAVNGPTAMVSSFIMDPATGALKPLNKVTSAGAGPCYVSLDDAGKIAFVANYYGS